MGNQGSLNRNPNNHIQNNQGINHFHHGNQNANYTGNPNQFHNGNIQNSMNGINNIHQMNGMNANFNNGLNGGFIDHRSHPGINMGNQPMYMNQMGVQVQCKYCSGSG